MKIKKIDAARSQLDTAIQLWFQDADPVSIHTLVYAAHEIIDVVSKQMGRTDTLIFDSIYVRPDARDLWLKITRGPANFFKHGARSKDVEIEFMPESAYYFIGMSIHGLKLMGEPLSPYMTAYYSWIGIARPDLLNEQGAKMVSNLGNVDVVRRIVAKGKGKFLKDYFATIHSGI